MKMKQNQKTEPRTIKNESLGIEIASPKTSKSFRSKLFQKRALISQQKIGGKQVTFHNPIYKKYLSVESKSPDNNKISNIWGCLFPQTHRSLTVRQNYLKRNINTTQNLLKKYVKRRNRFTDGIQTTMQFSEELTQRQQQNKSFQQSNPQVTVSQFFTQIKHHTAKQRVNQNVEREHEQIQLSQLLLSKMKTEKYNSRFGERISRKQGYFKNQQMSKINNKSIYKLSLEQLKQNIRWKKQFLGCLNQSILQVKTMRF